MPANPDWARSKAASASATVSTTNGSAHDPIEAGLDLHLAPSATARSMAVTGVGISNAAFRVSWREHDTFRPTGHRPRYRPTDR